MAYLCSICGEPSVTSTADFKAWEDPDTKFVRRVVIEGTRRYGCAKHLPPAPKEFFLKHENDDLSTATVAEKG